MSPKNFKNKKEGDITLHYIDILPMYCRFSPSFFISAVLVV